MFFSMTFNTKISTNVIINLPLLISQMISNARITCKQQTDQSQLKRFGDKSPKTRDGFYLANLSCNASKVAQVTMSDKRFCRLHRTLLHVWHGPKANCFKNCPNAWYTGTLNMHVTLFVCQTYDRDSTARQRINNKKSCTKYWLYCYSAKYKCLAFVFGRIRLMHKQLKICC